MAAFSKQIEQIKKQLGELETSQRLAIFLCGIIVAGSLLMLSQFALSPELIPLYTDELSDEEMARITRQLSMIGEEFEEKNNTVWVRPASQRELLMKMAVSDVSPRSAKLTFEDLIQDSKPWTSESRNRWERNVALMNELSKVIETDEKFRNASVFVAGEDKRRLLGKGTLPTASVKVTMASGYSLNKELVKSLADLVAGAVPRLTAERVTVIDLATGRSFAGGEQEEHIGSRLYELQRHKEKTLQADIQELLSYIPGVIVGVAIKIEDELVSSTQTQLEKPALLSEKFEEKEFVNRAQGVEPGVDANTGVALTGGNEGSSESLEKTEKTYQTEAGGKVTETRRKPGAVRQASASIQIPRSYFVGVYKSQSGDPDSEPSEDQIAGLIVQKTQELEETIKPVLPGEEEPVVKVSTYDDAIAYSSQSSPNMPNEARDHVMDFVADNGKQIGLVALALVAMAMMLHMVRKSAQGLVVPKASSGAGEGYATGDLGELVVDAGAIGEASSPDGFLIAPETDENSIRARHIAQQVAELVENDPEGAAQLVRRWIEREP